MGKKNDGAKGAKIGRGTRSPSGKMQAKRTERNKAKRQAAAGGSDEGLRQVHIPREVVMETKRERELRQRTEHRRAFKAKVEEARACATIEAQTLDGRAARLILPKGVQPKDFHAAMKARILRHRAEHKLGVHKISKV